MSPSMDLQYLILFNASSNCDTDYQPFIANRTRQTQDCTLPHGFDKDLIVCLPALWYCLHLPRTLYDLEDIPTHIIHNCQTYDFGHDIVLLPTLLLDRSNVISSLKRKNITLTLAPNDLYEVANDLSKQLDVPLGVTPISSLSDKTLAQHWQAIHTQLAPQMKYLGKEPKLCERLDLASLLLPTRLLLRQMNAPVDSAALENIRDKAQRLGLALHLQAVISAIARMEREGKTLLEAEKIADAVLAEEKQRLAFPVSVAVPGIPMIYAKKCYPRNQRNKSEISATENIKRTWKSLYTQREDVFVERAVIDFLVTHRAVARNGLGITLPDVSGELYGTLAKLEHHLSVGRPKARTVWRLLNNLGTAAALLVDKDAQLAIRCASFLTVFSSFPVGLVILPEDTAPLVCKVPIAYRPLLPLTRALQYELSQPPIFYLGSGFRILIAECIDENDLVGKMSRIGWSVLRNSLKEVPQVNCDYVEVARVEELRAILDRHKHEVLVLSAHGHFNPRNNVAGIVVGDRFCLGPELGDVPPLVILSACHVAPRGVGPVSIADLLLRQGAIAVLGTQVPVNVFRNATLMVRFFVYVGEALANREPLKSMADILHRVLVSNAVNDIVNGNKTMLAWWGSNIGDRTILEEFMSHRSSGRIRKSHVYADTERVLEEIASECGIREKFRAWLSSPGYIPESLFYTFIGWPERIVVQDPVIQKEKQCRDNLVNRMPPLAQEKP